MCGQRVRRRGGGGQHVEGLLDQGSVRAGVAREKRGWPRAIGHRDGVGHGVTASGSPAHTPGPSTPRRHRDGSMDAHGVYKTKVTFEWVGIRESPPRLVQVT